jgi:hypothetical protein
MTITITIPDELAGLLSPADAPRSIMEAFAVEGFRSGRLTSRQVGHLLGFDSRQQTDRFLGERGAAFELSTEEVLADADTARLALKR